MASACEGMSRSEAGAISLISNTLGLDRDDLQAALLKVKCVFAANRPMRERVRERITQGVPWTQKEKLATFLTGLGAAVSVQVASFAMAGKLAAFGASVAGALALPASAGVLVICALVAICGFILFHAFGELQGALAGLGDAIRAF